jgi:hypothetical protein
MLTNAGSNGRKAARRRRIRHLQALLLLQVSRFFEQLPPLEKKKKIQKI